MSTKTIVQVVVIGLLLVSSACKPRLIPNSSVPDTKENRIVTAFMEDYKNAIISRSVPDIMSLVSPDYLETNGTSDAYDDYNYSQLQDKLTKTYAHVKEVTLNIHIQNIVRKEDKIMVFYFYNQHSLVNVPTGEQWMALNDVNRLVLKLKGRTPSDGLEIISGL
jgi:hypothetical protein